MPNTNLQPSSRMCFICGVENPVGLKLRFHQIEPGVVEAHYSALPHFQGYPGILHGGIISAILDEVSGRVWMGTVDKPRFMFTAKLEVLFRKNVPIGKPLRLVGKAGEDRGQSATAWGGIYDAESGNLLAECHSVLVNVPEDKLSKSTLTDTGWRVYPEE
jgi:acyl-coenzyme A thioesterase PaaI-like protein